MEYLICDGRCLSDIDAWGLQACCNCPGKKLTPIKRIAAVPIVVTVIVLLCVAVSVGMLIGYSAKQSLMVEHVEETIIKSIEQGKPFMFTNGRIGVIIEEQLARNGKTIAYRAISFTYPEEDPAVYIPIKNFKRDRRKSK